MAWKYKRRNMYQRLSAEEEEDTDGFKELKNSALANKAYDENSQEVEENTSKIDERETRTQFLQKCHRRQAVCENIEREIVDERGISLRKLRKYMILELILREVNLL